MCIAVAGRVVEKDGNKGKVDVRGNILRAELSLVDAQVGDYVLMHAGCAISLVTKSEVEELDELFSEMETYDG
jgi:hydrogenase expression/formation protein HypC